VNPIEEDVTMAEKKVSQALKVGDTVKIHHYGIPRGKIVELRGPLAPGGKEVYRVIVRRKPKPMYIEVIEDEVELIPPEE
jgi:hypothetical protein